MKTNILLPKMMNKKNENLSKADGNSIILASVISFFKMFENEFVKLIL